MLVMNLLFYPDVFSCFVFYSMHWVCMCRSFRDAPVGLKNNNCCTTSLQVVSEYFRELFCLKNLTDQSWNCAMPSDVFLLKTVSWFMYLFWYIHMQPFLCQSHLSIVLSDLVVEVMWIRGRMIRTHKKKMGCLALSKETQSFSWKHDPSSYSHVYNHVGLFFVCLIKTPYSLIVLSSALILNLKRAIHGFCMILVITLKDQSKWTLSIDTCYLLQIRSWG